MNLGQAVSQGLVCSSYLRTKPPSAQKEVATKYCIPTLTRNEAWHSRTRTGESPGQGILSALEKYTTVYLISRRTGLPPQQVRSTLHDLSVNGFVTALDNDCWKLSE